ncbi:hypothetical protein [Lactobacillus helveticus]|uniref:hypothetical protein n=1 Tax=Lactobacillus helveticus TaxID=1587 RepID=UPI0015621120|nr:hypothetical protein [Lactobacillus helveticus]NRN89957.1 hypothetical protein [Lactobacillus helveticus]NRO45629.1 hypothetical protein [Lactobacillus helveticus]NRO55327.1 hypothetical protein [Lactobacillus helveticus]
MKFYYKISMNILLNFLSISHDTNPIHQQINAVIPGNLLVVLLEKNYQQHFNQVPTAIKINFQQPAYLNDNLLFEISLTKFQITNSIEQLIAEGGWQFD